MISVLIPTNRVDLWLFQAVQSVLDSEFCEEIEVLIVVNNCILTEESENSLKSLVSEKRSIQLLDLGAISIVDALNAGLNAASFEFVARLDSDDLVLPERMSLQFQYLTEHSSCVLVGSDVKVVDTSLRYLNYVAFPTSNFELKNALYFGNTLAHPTVMFRKSVAFRINGYSDLYPYAEDYDFYLRLSTEGDFCSIPRPLIQYRISNTQVSELHAETQLDSTQRLITQNSTKNFSGHGGILKRLKLQGRMRIFAVRQSPINTTNLPKILSALALSFLSSPFRTIVLLFSIVRKLPRKFRFNASPKF